MAVQARHIHAGTLMSDGSALILLGIAILSAVLGLYGITEMRKAIPIRQLLSEPEQRSLDTQMLIHGQKLCPSCKIRYCHADMCDICEKVRVLEIHKDAIEPREPVRVADHRIRSHVGYRPLYLQEGFSDMFQKENPNKEV